jgi:Uma2 family endonuclease
MTIRARFYAIAGITEYWVLDVNGRRLLVHRKPEAGRYQLVSAYSALEKVAPLTVPEAMFKVGSFFTAL